MFTSHFGGNRKGFPKQIRNIIIVWLLTGAWHGASWNFILWGLFFGILLILEKLFILKLLNKVGSIFSHIYTMFFVLISWVIFAFEDLKQVGNYLQALFSLKGIPLINLEAIFYFKNYIIVIIIGILFSTPLLWKKIENLESKKNILTTMLVTFGYIGILILCTASLVSDSYNPFLYFRF